MLAEMVHSIADFANQVCVNSKFEFFFLQGVSTIDKKGVSTM